MSEDVEKGAKGGPQWNTTILALSSGKEKRNQNWSRQRGKWSISYGMDTKANQEEILSFFYLRAGREYGFRFKDWTDFEIGTDSTDTPQEIATSDGTTQAFQIVRRYTDGSYTFDRKITRPVSGTVRVFFGSTEQLSGWTVDTETGIITFTSAPAASPTISIGVICEFDVPVRFDVDYLPVTASRDDVFGFESIDLIELKE